METQQILEMLKAMQKERKADLEQMKANRVADRECRKQIMDRTDDN
jgi:hypothetical protein